MTTTNRPLRSVGIHEVKVTEWPQAANRSPLLGICDMGQRIVEGFKKFIRGQNPSHSNARNAPLNRFGESVTNPAISQLMGQDDTEFERALYGHVPSNLCFFDELPGQRIQRTVSEMAVDSHQLRRPDLTLSEFRELMARAWMIKCIEFERVTTEHGFITVDRFPVYMDAAAIVLTLRGSFVTLSRPDARGKRVIEYKRIPLRGDTDIKDKQIARLASSIRFGDRVKVARCFDTSAAMAIYINPDANLEDLDEATDAIVNTLTGVDIELGTIA